MNIGAPGTGGVQGPGIASGAQKDGVSAQTQRVLTKMMEGLIGKELGGKPPTGDNLAAAIGGLKEKLEAKGATGPANDKLLRQAAFNVMLKGPPRSSKPAGGIPAPKRSGLHSNISGF